MANSNLINFELFAQEIEALKQHQTSLDQEVISKLKSRFNKETEFLDDTSLDFNFRLQTAVERTKDDIDIKIESIKSKLDLQRDLMFKDLDCQEEQLRKYVHITLKLT